MTLEEFRHKRRNIEKTHPAPETMSEEQRIRFYSKIAQRWIDDLDNLADVKKAQEEERELIAQFL